MNINILFHLTPKRPGLIKFTSVAPLTQFFPSGRKFPLLGIFTFLLLRTVLHHFTFLPYFSSQLDKHSTVFCWQDTVFLRKSSSFGDLQICLIFITLQPVLSSLRFKNVWSWITAKTYSILVRQHPIWTNVCLFGLFVWLLSLTLQYFTSLYLLNLDK